MYSPRSFSPSPSIRFTEVPGWLTQPLPWFDREAGYWQHEDDIEPISVAGRSSGAEQEAGEAGGLDDKAGDQIASEQDDSSEAMQRDQWRDWLKSQRGTSQQGGGPDRLKQEPEGGNRHDEEWRAWRKGRRRSDDE